MLAESIVWLQLLVGCVFLASGIGKLRDPWAFAQGIRAYDLLPRQGTRIAAWTIIVAELGIAASHLTGLFVQAVSTAAIVMLGAFLSAVMRAVRRGDAVPCLCFGAGSEELASFQTVARLALLLAAETTILAFATVDQSDIGPFEGSLEQTLLMLALSGVVLAALRWGFSMRDLHSLHKGNARRRNCPKASH